MRGSAFGGRLREKGGKENGDEGLKPLFVPFCFFDPIEVCLFRGGEDRCFGLVHDW